MTFGRSKLIRVAVTQTLTVHWLEATRRNGEVAGGNLDPVVDVGRSEGELSPSRYGEVAGGNLDLVVVVDSYVDCFRIREEKL